MVSKECDRIPDVPAKLYVKIIRFICVCYLNSPLEEGASRWCITDLLHFLIILLLTDCSPAASTLPAYGHPGLVSSQVDNVLLDPVQRQALVPQPLKKVIIL